MPGVNLKIHLADQFAPHVHQICDLVFHAFCQRFDGYANLLLKFILAAIWTDERNEQRVIFPRC